MYARNNIFFISCLFKVAKDAFGAFRSSKRCIQLKTEMIWEI